jgi:hypothetical protein
VDVGISFGGTQQQDSSSNNHESNIFGGIKASLIESYVYPIPA